MKRFLTLLSFLPLTLIFFVGQTGFAKERETFLSDFKLSDGRYKNLGFRVENIKKGSIYERIGLKNGDIIKKVNKKPISNSQEAKSVFHELKTAKIINLTIQRDDQEISLHYRIK